MLGILLTILYVIVCTFLILVVLLQTGKRADLAGAFGGGGSQTAFGARGAATLLAKVTTACAVLFMVIALSLSILSKQVGDAGTVLDEIPDTTPAPTAPAPSDPTLGFGDPATSESEDLPADPVEPGEDLPGEDAGTETEGEAPVEDPQP